MSFAKFLRTSFLLTDHLRVTASYVYLSILRRFSEHFFYITSRKLLFYVKLAEFQPPDTVKNYFTGASQAFYTSSRSSHSKAFVYINPRIL